VRRNVVRRRNRLRHQRQVVCPHWWGRLLPANARLRAHFFSASHDRSSDGRTLYARVLSRTLCCLTSTHFPREALLWDK
jgi:hypothetical protein